MSSRARLTIAAAAALLALSGIAAGSSAAVKRVKTKVEITNGGASQFEGNVSSRRAACEADRKVILFRLSEARTAKQAGKTRTDEDGHWTLEGQFPDGDYKARAPKTETRRLVCLRGGSQTLPAR